MALKLEKLSVLVVEDTEAMLNLICCVLESMGIGSIHAATNADKAYKVIKDFNPDIILCDWEMPECNGIHLTKEIRNNMLMPNRMVPVVLVTGYASEKRVNQAINAGVTEFLAKPFSANDLSKRIAYVINNPRAFIDTNDYFGPDRRRKNDPHYKGPWRRQDD